MPKTLLSVLTGLLLTAAFARGQDPHFAGVQGMNTWYNPALKTDKIPQAHVSVRSVTYPNIISYSSKAATIEIPLVSKDATEDDHGFFINLAAGIGTDNSSDNFMNASTAMLAVSYAMPVDNDNTYLAMGFQGNYSFNRVGNGDSYHFPDQFDKYGALNAAMKTDPFASGYNYGYFTAGAGIAFFHAGEERQWYIGGSIRHFNHPYTEWNYSARLPSNNGIQAGYTAPIGNSATITGYGNFSWQAGKYEQFIGARYTRHLNDSTKNGLSFGIGYRAGDALVPEAGLQINASRLSFCYEINIPGTPSGHYHRRALEFSYRLNL